MGTAVVVETGTVDGGTVVVVVAPDDGTTAAPDPPPPSAGSAIGSAKLAVPWNSAST